MVILGIHFGHDSSISLIENGKIVFCVEKERLCKVRHVIGISYDDIKETLNKFNFNINKIDYCSVTSTQHVEYIFFDKNLNFTLDYKKLNSEPSHWFHKRKRQIKEQINKKYLINLVEQNANHPYLEKIEKKNFNLKNKKFFGSIESFYQSKKWLKKIKLKNISSCFEKNENNELMQLPIRLKLGKNYLPGYIVSHHFAHAAYCFYSSDFNESAIFTQDGSIPTSPYLSGMCFYGKKNKLYPLMPHYLNLGRMYDSVSELIGFDRTSGPGKMMGLAPYGKPKFFDKKFIGNFFDHEKLKIKNFKHKDVKWKPHRIDQSSNKWISHCLFMAKKLKYNFNGLGNTNKILDKINIDIASSTQLLLEETLLYTANQIKKIFTKKKINTKNLCLSGGTFLNCPANSKIYNKKLFRNMFIPPAIHDGGLSIGSAQAIYFNTLKKKRVKHLFNKTEAAFLGISYKKNQISKKLKKYKNIINFKKEKSISKSIAKEISDNKIVAVYTGRSEIGPRALGHRSILADPRNRTNWKKVNIVKSREQWRPFAPVVAEKDFKKYFCFSPKKTPYMLFTAKVYKKILPAITHFDDSSRVQTVNKKDNNLFKILKEFEKITSVPVLMNTSFNGPGQPIVETYEDAINFFLNSKLDVLYIENYKVTKRY